MYRENGNLFFNGENCKGWPEFRRHRAPFHGALRHTFP